MLSTGVNVRNALLPIANTDTGQAAAVITGGYRARVAWPGGGSSSMRDGLYVAANYNYLRGFLYEDDGLNLNLATDNAGLLTTGSSIVINHRHATSGTGMSLDLGVGAVVDRWQVGFGANGIANRINWTGVQQSTLTLASVAAGNGAFVQSVTTPAPDARVELPVDYRGNVTYDAGTWSATAEAGHGFGGGSFHAGVERRLRRLQVRGGARYTFGTWNPTAGAGFDLSRKVSLDVAVFGTNANIERKRQMAIAASIRINHY